MKVCDGIILNITSGNRDKTMTSHGFFGVLDSCIASASTSMHVASVNLDNNTTTIITRNSS